MPRGYRLFLERGWPTLLPGLFVFPNVELRLKTRAERGNAPDVHLLISLATDDHLSVLTSKLADLTFVEKVSPALEIDGLEAATAQILQRRGTVIVPVDKPRNSWGVAAAFEMEENRVDVGGADLGRSGRLARCGREAGCDRGGEDVASAGDGAVSEY